MKPIHLCTVTLLAVIMASCTEAEVLYTRPDTSGPKITFTLPPKVHETIYPITRAGTWGLANEFDLTTGVIYMFEETTTGAGYKYKQRFNLGGDPAITTPSGQPPILSTGGSQTNGERPFTLTLGSGFTGTSTKRFYFVCNLDTSTVATKTQLGDLTLQVNNTKEDDFKTALQSLTDGYIKPAASETTPLSLPMYSWQAGKPYLEIDLASIPTTNKVSMVRSVARFDIVNYAQSTGQADPNNDIVTDFTITAIHLGGVATKGYLFPSYNAAPYAAATADRTDKVITVNSGDAMNNTVYSIDASGNASTTNATPAFYLLPTDLNSTTTTIQIEGDIYGTSMIKNITAPVGLPDDILPNRLYRIYITKSSDPNNEIAVQLKVEDWENEQKLPVAPVTRSISGLYSVASDGTETLVSSARNGNVPTAANDTTLLRFYYNSDKKGELPDIDFDMLKYPYVKIDTGVPTLSPVTRTSKQYRTAYTIKISNDKKRVMVNVPLVVSAAGGVSTRFLLSHLAMGKGDFAFSNIYWDGTKLTFDTIPSVDQTQQKQGVFFKWGSLIGVSPTGKWNAMGTKLYVPDVDAKTWSTDKYAGAGGNPWNGSDWVDIPYCDTNFAGDPAGYEVRDHNRLIDVDYKNTKFTGDICKYLSETGAVKGSWRMATLFEFVRHANYVPVPWLTYDAANSTKNIWATWDTSTWTIIADDTTTDDGTYVFTRGLVVDSLDYFPPGGFRENGELGRPGYEGALWFGSSSAGNSSAFNSFFQQSIILPCYAYTRQMGMNVRCVKN